MPTALSNLLVCGILALGLIVTLWRGPRTAFILIGLPCTILLMEVPNMDIPLLPDPGAAFGAMYGILLGVLIRGGERFTFKWNSIDTLVVLIALAQVINSAVNGIFWTGVSSWGTQFLGWLMPYFLARLAYQSWHDRRKALQVIIFCIAVIAFFALIETRLWPHYYRSMIHRVLGMATLIQEATWRYGFFRADSAFSHPIYLGNACIALIGLVIVLARTTGWRMSNWRVWAPVGAAIFALITSISYGSYLALAASTIFFLAMRYVSPVRKLLTVLTIAGILVGFAVTLHMRNLSSHTTADMPGWERSFRTRVLIIQRSWPFVTNAGLWGHGANLTKDQLQLDSVDNAYLLWAMRQGWVYLALWLLLPVLLAHRAVKAFATIHRPELRTPLAAGVACLLGVMVAMYTVWSAWDFISIWTALLGFVVSLTDFHLQAPSAAMVRRARRSMRRQGAAQADEPLILVPEA